jgi:hypothetical protein
MCVISQLTGLTRQLCFAAAEMPTMAFLVVMDRPVCYRSSARCEIIMPVI